MVPPPPTEDCRSLRKTAESAGQTKLSGKLSENHVSHTKTRPGLTLSTKHFKLRQLID